MRAAHLFLLVPLAASAVETRLTNPIARYSAMLEQSPFALATVQEAPPRPTESFTANWVLAGLARLRNEKGEEKDMVSVRSRDLQIAFTLLGDAVVSEGEAKGVSIQSIDWQEPARKTIVMLRRGSEVGKVEFSQDAGALPAVAMNPNGAPLNPNQSRIAQLQQTQAQLTQLILQARTQQAQNLVAGAKKGPAVFNPASANTGVVAMNSNGAALSADQLRMAQWLQMRAQVAQQIQQALAPQNPLTAGANKGPAAVTPALRP